jgi:hypothetical protein
MITMMIKEMDARVVTAKVTITSGDRFNLGTKGRIKGARFGEEIPHEELRLALREFAGNRRVQSSEVYRGRSQPFGSYDSARA